MWLPEGVGLLGHIPKCGAPTRRPPRRWSFRCAPVALSLQGKADADVWETDKGGIWWSNPVKREEELKGRGLLSQRELRRVKGDQEPEAELEPSSRRGGSVGQPSRPESRTYEAQVWAQSGSHPDPDPDLDQSFRFRAIDSGGIGGASHPTLTQSRAHKCTHTRTHVFIACRVR